MAKRVFSAALLMGTMAGCCFGCLPKPALPTTVLSEQVAAPTKPEARPPHALAIEHYLKSQLRGRLGQSRAAIEELRKALIYDHDSPYLHARLGAFYAHEGLWRLAGKEAQLALTDPAYVPAILMQGRTQVHFGKIAQAIASYQKILKIDPQNIDAYIKLAHLFLSQNQKDQALATLTRMTQTNPESGEGFRRLADLYFENGEETRAEANYRHALLLAPYDTDTTRVLTGLFEQQGRYHEAIKVFIDALESSPQNPYYMSYMATLYLKAGDEKSANAYFDQLRDSSPDNARLIAHAYSRLNRYPQAIRELTELLKNNPHYHNERLLLAIMYEERKDWDQAIAHLQLIPRQAKIYFNAQVNIGYCLRHQRKFDLAEQSLLQAIELSRSEDDLGRVYRILAEVYAQKKQFEKGLQVLEQALAKHPALLDLAEAKASLLYEAGQREESIGLLEATLKTNPRNISLLYLLSATHERMGQIDKSIEVMRQVVDIDPNNASALNFIGYTLADQGQKLAEAERLIRRALLLNPGNGAITDSLGWLLYRIGKYEQALDYLRRADRISPGEAVIIMHVGDALLKLGQRKGAIDEYRRALTTNPIPRDRDEILKRLEKLGIKTQS